jgi:hypothetical protein
MGGGLSYVGFRGCLRHVRTTTSVWSPSSLSYTKIKSIEFLWIADGNVLLKKISIHSIFSITFNVIKSCRTNSSL